MGMLLKRIPYPTPQSRSIKPSDVTGLSCENVWSRQYKRPNFFQAKKMYLPPLHYQYIKKEPIVMTDSNFF